MIWRTHFLVGDPFPVTACHLGVRVADGVTTHREYTTCTECLKKIDGTNQENGDK